jgi:hypothetical protein
MRSLRLARQDRHGVFLGIPTLSIKDDHVARLGDVKNERQDGQRESSKMKAAPREPILRLEARSAKLNVGSIRESHIVDLQGSAAIRAVSAQLLEHRSPIGVGRFAQFEALEI